MKNRLFAIAISFLPGILLFAQQAEEKVYTASELKADLGFYQQKLQQYHPNLYLYASPDRVSHFFDSLSASIDRPMTEREFYGIVSLTSSVVSDGHTLVLPSAGFSRIHNAKSSFFPHQLMIVDGELYVRMVCSSDRDIPEGARIIRINGVGSSEILETMMRRQVRDGWNLAYPTWILDNYFRDYYSFLFGHPDQFEVEYESLGMAGKTNIDALPKDSIYAYRTKNYPGVRFDKEPGKGLMFELDTANNRYAVLSIKDFHDDVLRSVYGQRFSTVIPGFFDRLIASGCQYLILDLRNNQGGDIENAVTLLSLLISESFRVVNGYSRVQDGRIQSCGGPASGMHRPADRVYKGKVIVLINGGSFSNSGIVASCLREHKRATFIGSESGGNPAILAGFPKDFTLPNTGILVEIPTKRFTMTSETENTGRGIQPDYVVQPSVQDRLKGIDTVLGFAIGLGMGK